MKINYRLANGKTVEVEVTESQAEVIIKTKQKSENNETKHKLRKAKGEASLDYLFDEYEWEAADSRVDVQGEVERQEESERTERAVGCLTDKQQAVIRLHFYDGYKFAEIAELLGISKAAVTKHKDAALQALRKILKNF